MKKLLLLLLFFIPNLVMALPPCPDGDAYKNQCFGAFTAHGNKYVGEWKDNKKHGHGTIIFAKGVTNETNMTATNLLGIAAGAITSGASGAINTWGSRNEVQTSLTVASDYYVQSDGTITTTSTSPAQLIGQAITATQINIKDYTG